jgi:oxygen-independent coproporphyrinogen-3 oxidase
MQESRSAGSTEVFGIYVHVPFCRRKCNYCDFLSFECPAESGNNAVDDYIAALCREVSSAEISSAVSEKQITVYVGGGTPSVLSESQLCRMLEALSSYIANCRGAVTEFTVEANPESLNAQKLKVLKAHGVNRLSIGVQSFDDKVLEILGRVHNSARAVESYELAKNAGFDNVNIDLIFGIPGQTQQSFLASLESAVCLGARHISAYSLSIEDGTKFSALGLKKDEEQDAQMYETAMDFLKSRGFHHYEISNFAIPGFECKHNVNYWNNGQYRGFGAGAVSHIKGRRISNTCDIKEYVSGNYTAGQEELPPDKKLSEGIMLGLRMIDGIFLENEIMAKYASRIARLVEDGLVEKKGNVVKLTGKGTMLADCVFREFV